MKVKNILICLTASFPYGKKETFFENELPYLSNSYDLVVIIPTYNPSASVNKREVPENVVVYPPSVSNHKLRRVVDGLGCAYIAYFIQDFFQQKVYKSTANVKRLFNSYLVFQKSYRDFRDIVKRLEGRLTMYSYWAEAPLFFTKECQALKKVVRMHRTDFYLEENNGYLPLRQKIYDSADVLLPISKDISTLLEREYGILGNKIFINHLGVDNAYGKQSFVDNEGVIRIVSCSRVDPIKRVELIAESMFQYDGDRCVEWHHFGDGVSYDALKALVMNNKNQNVKVVLHGWAHQKAIYEFYAQHSVHWFINLSKHEGVPVSIMEAISFAIPAIATDVGATRECVNDENGVILPLTCSPADIVAIMKIRYDSSEYLDKRAKAYECWLEKFVASKNYVDLVNKLNENEGVDEAVIKS